MVTLYTREYGKLRAVGKGARRSTSKLVGHLEPLTQLRLALAKGRNLDIITQAQVLESFTPLKENPDQDRGFSKGDDGQWARAETKLTIYPSAQYSTRREAVPAMTDKNNSQR